MNYGLVFQSHRAQNTQTKALCYKSWHSYHMQKHSGCHQITEVQLGRNKNDFSCIPPFPGTSRKMRILFTKQVLTLPNMTQNCLCKSVTNIEVSQTLFLLLKGVFVFSCQPSTTHFCLKFYPLNADHPLSL